MRPTGDPHPLLSPGHPVLALCLSPGWTLHPRCSPVSSPVSVNTFCCSGLDPGPSSSPHLVQSCGWTLLPAPSSACWLRLLQDHGHGQWGHGLCLILPHLPALLPHETALLWQLPDISCPSDKWSSIADLQEIPPGDLRGGGWSGWCTVLWGWRDIKYICI